MRADNSAAELDLKIDTNHHISLEKKINRRDINESESSFCFDGFVVYNCGADLFVFLRAHAKLQDLQNEAEVCVVFEHVSHYFTTKCSGLARYTNEVGNVIPVSDGGVVDERWEVLAAAQGHGPAPPVHIPFRAQGLAWFGGTWWLDSTWQRVVFSGSLLNTPHVVCQVRTLVPLSRPST